jgi:hypothetical protein
MVLGLGERLREQLLVLEKMKAVLVCVCVGWEEEFAPRLETDSWFGDKQHRPATVGTEPQETGFMGSGCFWFGRRHLE